MPTVGERRDELARVGAEAAACRQCPVLADERQSVVFGSGGVDAPVLLLAAAPSRLDDELGTPLAGAAGELLAELFSEVGLAGDDIYMTTAIKCRPPGNRDPLPAELDRCRDWLERQLELVRPRLVCTLGNFATRLVRADPAGITTVHGQVEERTIGTVAVRLLPLYHPAAALYARTLLDGLRADIATIPELLGRPALVQSPVAPVAESVAPVDPPAPPTPQDDPPAPAAEPDPSLDLPGSVDPTASPSPPADPPKPEDLPADAPDEPSASVAEPDALPLDPPDSVDPPAPLSPPDDPPAPDEPPAEDEDDPPPGAQLGLF